MPEDRLLITSAAKGIKAAWLKTFFSNNKHLIGTSLFDSEGNAIGSYAGYLDDDIYSAQVARGNVAGSSLVFSYGESYPTGALTNQPLFPTGMGASVNVPPSSGVQMTVVSSSADDDKDAGTGARSVEIHYLDVNLDQQVEEVFLEGLTPVTTTATDIRFVQCTHVHTKGSGGVAAGNITVYTTGPIIYSYIVAGYIRCSSSFRRVPAGKRLMIKALHAGCISDAKAKGIVRMVSSKLGDNDYTEDGFIIPFLSMAFQDSSSPIPLDMPIPVDSGVVVGLEYDVDDAAVVTGGYIGYFEDV